MPFARGLRPTSLLGTALGVTIALSCLPAFALASPAKGAPVEGDLGPPNYTGYCQSLGLVRAAFTAEATKQWGCLGSDNSISPLDVQKACEFTFAQRPILAKELAPGALYTWQCLTGAGASPGGAGAGPGGGSGTTQASGWMVAALIPVGRTAKIAALLKNGGYAARFRAPGAGRLTIGWYYLAKGARISRAAPKPILVASGKASFAGAGTRSVKLTLTTRGRQLLRHARRLKLTARASFSPSAGAAVVTLRTFTLKR